jgi:hypothetical protein
MPGVQIPNPPLSLCQWRAAAASPNTNNGGTCTDQCGSPPAGRCRTIADIAGFYCHRQVANSSGDSAYDAEVCGNSFATPRVAGMALNFIDSYKQFFSNVIETPGVLYAWMLQMGGLVNGSFNRWTGGGLAQMRMANEAGLDAPWQFWSVQTCMTQGQTTLYPVNGGAQLAAATDQITVTAWFYDKAYQIRGRTDGDRVDEYTIRLRDLDTMQVLATSPTNINQVQDEKKRIRFSGVGGRRLRVEIQGKDIKNENQPGCPGSNRARVFLAILAEDSSRNDSNGPFWNGTHCTGVAPMVY